MVRVEQDVEVEVKLFILYANVTISRGQVKLHSCLFDDAFIALVDLIFVNRHCVPHGEGVPLIRSLFHLSFIMSNVELLRWAAMKQW